MNPCILNMAISHRRQLFSEVRAVLVLDIFDDGIPAIQRRLPDAEWKREIQEGHA